MSLTGGTTRSPIGVDLGGRYIKAMQLSRARKRWRIEAAAQFAQSQVNVPIDAAMARRLADVLDRQGFAGRQIVLAVPGGKLEHDILEVPPRTSGAPVEQIAQAELARTAKLTPGDFEMACWDLPAAARAGAGGSVMAVAVRHSDANSLLDTLETEGLDVVAIDSAGLAMARALTTLACPDGRIHAGLDIGWNSALLVLVHQGVVVYQRSFVEAGLGALQRNICEQFELQPSHAGYVLDQLDLRPEAATRTEFGLWTAIRALAMRHADALASELQVAFSYAAHRYPASPVARLLLTGGGAAVAGLCEHLAESLQVEARIVAPNLLVECPVALRARCQSPALTLALGLAQYGGD